MNSNNNEKWAARFEIALATVKATSKVATDKLGDTMAYSPRSSFIPAKVA